VSSAREHVKPFVGPVWDHCQCVAYSPMFVGAPSVLVLNELSSCSNLELLGKSWEPSRHAVQGPLCLSKWCGC